MRINKRLFTAAIFTGILAAAAAFTVYAKERLAVPEETYWDGSKATWEEVENASKYEVRLYREGSAVSGATIETKKTSYSFRSKMTKEGFYSFRVRALPKNKSYSESSWSEYSDEMLISAEEAKKIAEVNEAAKKERQANVNTGGSGPGDDSKMPTAVGVWKSNDTGWWYELSDGSYPKSSWHKVDDVWYYFNETGYMATGWVTLAEQTFYCDPASGKMLTGAQTIDGQAYQFNESGVLTTN